MDSQKQINLIMNILTIVIISFMLIHYFGFVYPKRNQVINANNTQIERLNTQNKNNKTANTRKNILINSDNIPMVNDGAILDYTRRRIKDVTPPEQRKILAKQQKEVRYIQYLQDCILDKYGDVNDNVHTEALFKINKYGDLEAYNVNSFKRWGVSDYNEEEEKLSRQKLEKALLEASPFQPFPSEMEKTSIITGLKLENGIVSGIAYPEQNPEPDWKHYLNQKNLPRNPKRYEDSKILFREAFLTGWSVNNIPISGVQLYINDLIGNKWKPVKTENNFVIVRGIIDDNYDIIEPAFIKKSDNKEANDNAIKALLNAKLPDRNSQSGQQIERLKSKSDKITIELHLEVK